MNGTVDLIRTEEKTLLIHGELKDLIRQDNSFQFSVPFQYPLKTSFSMSNLSDIESLSKYSDVLLLKSANLQKCLGK